VERKKSVLKISVVLGAIIIISLLHYLTQRQEKYQHLFYRELYFLPLILAGIWFGLRGAVLTSLSVTIAYLPTVFGEWKGFSVNDLDRLLEILLLNIIAVVFGILSNREKKVLKTLQESETLVALGSAVSNIVHDMKTPLVAIGGYARSIKRKLADEDPHHEKLDIIVKETHRLDELTRDILDYARPVSLKRGLQDLNDLIRDCCPIAAEAADQRNVKIETFLSPSLRAISVDPGALKRVLLNLIINAVQASPEGGVVTVRTDLKGREAVISIADDGPGIPSKVREEIFSPFFTTKKEGTGLGLSIALKIVKAHGGSITISDHDGKGAIFKVALPVGR
jgi:two-component system sensor histidine kinase HydH